MTKKILTSLALLFVITHNSTAQKLFKEKLITYPSEIQNVGQSLSLDFDGDGDFDSAVLDGTILRYFENNGESHFDLSTSIPMQYSYYVNMFSIDVDGDDDKDICISSGQQIHFIENNNGEFSGTSLLYETSTYQGDDYMVYSENSINNIFEVKVVDLDNDDIEEFITHQPDGLYLHHFDENSSLQTTKVNDVTGGYLYVQSEDDFCGMTGPEFWSGDLIAHDLNNDGLKDLVFSSFASSGFYYGEFEDLEEGSFLNVQFNLGEGIFAEVIKSPLLHGSEIIIEDLDESPVLLEKFSGVRFAVSAETESITVLENLDVQIAGEEISIADLFIEDFDGDGVKDLLFHSESKIVLQQNLGNQDFQESSLFQADPYETIAGIELLDANGDGLLDLVFEVHYNNYEIYSSTNKSFHVQINLGEGNWAEPQWLFNKDDVNSSLEVVHDDLLNQDAIMLSTKDFKLDRRIHFKYDLDSQNWKRQEVWNVGSPLPDEVLCFDVDLDGWEDILYFANAPTQLAWYRNNEGEFDSPPNYIAHDLPSTSSIAAKYSSQNLPQIFLVTEKGLVVFEQNTEGFWFKEIVDSTFPTSNRFNDQNKPSFDVYFFQGDYLYELNYNENDNSVSYQKAVENTLDSNYRLNSVDRQLMLAYNESDLGGPLVTLYDLSAPESDKEIESWLLPSIHGSIEDIFLQDVNGDDHIDIAFTTLLESGNVELHLIQNLGGYNFSERERVLVLQDNPDLTGEKYYALDLDRDGQIDLLRVHNDVEMIRKNKEDSSFSDKLLENFSSQNFCLSDLNKDGRPDVISQPMHQASFAGTNNSIGIKIAMSRNSSPVASMSLGGNCFTPQVINSSILDYAHSSVFWDFGNGETSTEIHPTLPQYDYGDYTITLEVCSSDICNTVSETVSAKSVEFSIPTETEIGIPTVFEDTSTGVDNWSWGLGDDQWEIAQKVEHIYTEPGEYLVELFLTDSKTPNCTSYHSQMIKVKKSSIHEPTVFPNPIKDDLTVLLPINLENTSFVLYDTYGSSINSGTFQGGKNQLSFGHLMPSLYVLEFDLPDGPHFEKLILR